MSSKPPTREAGVVVKGTFLVSITYLSRDIASGTSRVIGEDDYSPHTVSVGQLAALGFEDRFIEAYLATRMGVPACDVAIRRCRHREDTFVYVFVL
ncbi:hypothetical protein AD929_13170 [Gluconobacter potus]|uniref:Uncharacterized protein n=1 Tax=Gluconobacter potus TaxID=2724927 RepID=A0A149QS45_9PROT|nr:hypothetical protein [Gluconobacter potus]KXV00148.1 hypothetical protein AD929_13170 [Gluconobacter potus]